MRLHPQSRPRRRGTLPMEYALILAIGSFAAMAGMTRMSHEVGASWNNTSGVVGVTIADAHARGDADR